MPSRQLLWPCRFTVSGRCFNNELRLDNVPTLSKQLHTSIPIRWGQLFRALRPRPQFGEPFSAFPKGRRSALSSDRQPKGLLCHCDWDREPGCIQVYGKAPSRLPAMNSHACVHANYDRATRGLGNTQQGAPNRHPSGFSWLGHGVGVNGFAAL